MNDRKCNLGFPENVEKTCCLGIFAENLSSLNFLTRWLCQHYFRFLFLEVEKKNKVIIIIVYFMKPYYILAMSYILHL